MFIILYCLYPLLSSYVNSLEYDQRQTGDLNVLVDVKDVQIFALLKGDKEEYVNYDYAYDYSELTIKPQNRTTPKPFNGTSGTTEKIGTKDNITKTTTVLQESTVSLINDEITTLEYIATTSTPYDKDSTTTVKSYSDSTLQNTMTTKNVESTQRSVRRNCRKGYIMNQKGQCQLKLNTNENALLRLVKLSQKLKLKRENKRDNSA